MEAYKLMESWPQATGLSHCKLLHGPSVGLQRQQRALYTTHHPTRPARGRQSGIQSYLPLEGPGSQRTNIRSLWNFCSLSYPKDPGATKRVHQCVCTHVHTQSWAG